MPSRLVFPFLTLLQIFLNLGLVLCLNHSEILTREEAHSSFVDVAYFENRFQASEYATNIASYLVFWTGYHFFPEPGIFYGRFVKALVMASVTPITFWLLHLRFKQPWQFSLLTALAIGLMPGLYWFSVLGIDIGLEVPFGMLAMLLATYPSLRCSFASGGALAFSCLCYGAGLSFVLPVIWLLARHAQLWRRLLLAAVAGLLLLASAIAYWKNVQLLLLGGGGASLPLLTSWTRLQGDLLKGLTSYYYPLAGHPALGPSILPWITIGGLVFGLYRWKTHSVWLLLAVSSFLIALFSGQPPGVRRIIPFVPAVTILGGLLLQQLLGKWPRILLLAGCCLILMLGYDMARVANAWIRYRAFIPNDFPFAGATPNIDEAIENYKLGLLPVPDPKTLGSPRAHFAILNMLTRPAPIATFKALAEIVDPDDPPFPLDAARFSLTLRVLQRRLGPTSAAK